MSVNKKIIETEATVPVPEDAFNVQTYTGTGNSLSVTFGFEPDLIYFAARNATGRRYWYYKLNGTWKYLVTTSLQTEETGLPFTSNSTGFTINGYSFGINYSGLTMVCYGWKFASTSTSNTSGTITSNVQADTDKGISQVYWTGNSSNASIGHGLGGVPELIIAKSRTVSQNWAVYNQTAGSNYWLQLNGSTAKLDEAIWQDTTPTSTLFYVNGNVVINSGNSVAWLFRSIPGLSKIGSFTGNGTGSASNPIQNCGFRPDMVLVKNIDATGPWHCIDTARGGTGQNNKQLNWSDTGTEYSGLDSTDYIKFEDNGFRVTTSAASYNGSGNTIIYLAYKISS